jgi:hypothetical protein
MTTGYAPEKIQDTHWLNPQKRHGIPPKSWETIPEADKPNLQKQWDEALPTPSIIHEYSMHMNGVDRNAQMIRGCADERRNLRYWVALFVFIPFLQWSTHSKSTIVFTKLRNPDK